MQKLSKREIILIYVLVVVIIVAGGVILLLKPAMDKHEEVSDQLIALQEKKSQTDLAILQIESLKKEIQDYKTKIKKQKNNFIDARPNEELDTLITGMIVGSGLKPESLAIQDAESEDAAGTGEVAGTDQITDTNTDTNAVTDKTTGVDTAAETQGTGDAAAQGEAALPSIDSSIAKVSRVNVKIKGSLSQFINLVGVSAGQKGVVITEFKVASQEDEADTIASILAPKADKQKTYAYSAEVTFDVYQKGDS